MDCGAFGRATVAPTQMSPPSRLPLCGKSDMGRMQVLESMSALTGGLSSVHRYAQPAVDRIDTATRFGYLIGYQPQNTRIDRRYRRITVRVNRPGVTVLFRHGYYADDVPLPVDRRAFLTSRRISAAGQYGSAIPDIRVTLTPTVKQTQGAAEVSVVLNIDASRIAFTTVEGRHLADLDLVIYASDDKERLIKESRHKIDLEVEGRQLPALPARGHSVRSHDAGRPFAQVREGHRLRLRRRPARLLHRQAQVTPLSDSGHLPCESGRSNFSNLFCVNALRG